MWNVKVLPDLKIVEICYSGIVKPPELLDAVQETMQAAASMNTYLLLADCTALKGGHSVFDLYGIIELIMKSGMGHVIKEALLLPELDTAAQDVKFWETTCLNRGIRVQVFEDRQSALDWLLHNCQLHQKLDD